MWLYYRFGLSLRDVSELMLSRGIEVSHEAIRLWTMRFGTEYARRLRRTRGACSNIWHLDELCLMINGERSWLWRAVDDAGEVLDILAQRRRSARAAKRFLRKLVRGLRRVPYAIVTDRLASYAAAKAIVMPTVSHRRGWRQNNRVENSHQPVRQRERATAVQEPEARGALLFRVQHGLQPVSAGPPCALGTELSHRDAPALAGVGRHLGDDGVRCRRMKSRPQRLFWSRACSTPWRLNRSNNLTTPSRESPTSAGSVVLLEAAMHIGPSVSIYCDHIHRHEGEAGVRRILAVRSLARNTGRPIVLAMQDNIG